MSEIIQVQYDWFLFNVLLNDGAVGKSVRNNECWEPHIVNYLKNNLDKTSTFVDVGSNFGWHTIIASKLANKVYSFEPQKVIYDIQKNTIKDNNIENIILYNNGVGNTNEKKSMGSISYDYEGINTGDLSIGFGGEEIEVITLDSLNLDKVDIVKIDVQGYEKFVIEGCKETIKNYKPTFIIELENFQLDKFKYDSREIFSTMKELNYYPFFLDYIYPSDHVFVHLDNLNLFRKINKNHISKLETNNELNNNLILGVTEKLTYV
jgi:FkbM family methyltransferase